MIIERNQLTVLLNNLYDRDIIQINIDHPASEIDTLARINLDENGEAEIEFKLDRDGYIESRQNVEMNHGEIVNEIPDIQDYINCFLASNILSIDNRKEVMNFLERHGGANLQEGHEPVWLGIDTNLIPWRIQHVLDLDPSDRDKPLINGYALAEGIRKELDWDEKIDKSKQRALIDAFGDQYSEFLNQPKDWRRIGRYGLEMYREMKNHSYGTEIQGERRDEEIIESYLQFKDTGHRQAILLSNDDNFIERAKTAAIPAVRVDLPDELPSSKNTTWLRNCDALYLLSIMFGVIELPKTTLYGIWRGKKGENWSHEAIKVEPRSPKIEKSMRRDLEILDKYKEYG